MDHVEHKTPFVTLPLTSPFATLKGVRSGMQKYGTMLV